MSLNRIVLIGRTTAQPELRFSQSGTPIVKFTLAVNRTFSKEKEADFIDCVAFKGQAEATANNVNKGYLVAVDGSLRIRSYDDNQGVRRKAAEVVCDNVRFLDRGKDGGAGQSRSQGQQSEFEGYTFSEEDPF